MKYVFVVAASFMVGLAAMAFGIRQAVQSQPVPEFHEHADFALFLNGRQFDFAKDIYMHTEPCEVAVSGNRPVAYAHGSENVFEDDVDLHDMIGTVVHVHKEGITWANFFSSLRMQLTDSLFVDEAGNSFQNDTMHSFRFFVNGKEEQSLADRPIRELDRVLITYGPRDRTPESLATELAAVTTDACVSSGTCSHRGPAPLESCGATKETTSSLLLEWLGVN